MELFARGLQFLQETLLRDFFWLVLSLFWDKNEKIARCFGGLLQTKRKNQEQQQQQQKLRTHASNLANLIQNKQKRQARIHYRSAMQQALPLFIFPFKHFSLF